MKTTKATENTLTRWTRPQCYVGATWEDYFQSGVGQSRDSDALERANFDAMKAALAAIPTPADWPHDFAPWQVVSENHWAVGWVEWIAILDIQAQRNPIPANPKRPKLQHLRQ